MRAIETSVKSDNNGIVKINIPINQKEANVRIILLVSENNTNNLNNDIDDNSLWLKSMSKNPSFEFLNDPEEDIYTLENGEPFND
ncbi:MAG: hypothetical protein U0457_13310 [Candidatus Sericytochromatia bacterium]